MGSKHVADMELRPLGNAAFYPNPPVEDAAGGEADKFLRLLP